MPHQPESPEKCCYCLKRIYPNDRRVTLTFCSLDDYESWVEDLKEKG